MHNPTKRLVRILAVGWLAFGGTGLGLQRVLSGPAITVIIDRSYCDPGAWQQQVAGPYGELYSQVEQRRLSIDQVIYLSDLGVETAADVPTPNEVDALSTYGRFNSERLQQITADYPEATVLACHNSGP